MADAREPFTPATDIESASAGTARQTSTSNFAYALTGGVLGIVALFLIATILLAYSIMAEEGLTFFEDVLTEEYLDFDGYGYDGYFDEDFLFGTDLAIGLPR